jgi:hypothetical protein
LIVTELSVISATAALSVVSFNYYSALKGDDNQSYWQVLKDIS